MKRFKFFLIHSEVVIHYFLCEETIFAELRGSSVMKPCALG